MLSTHVSKDVGLGADDVRTIVRETYSSMKSITDLDIYSISCVGVAKKRKSGKITGICYENKNVKSEEEKYAMDG